MIDTPGANPFTLLLLLVIGLAAGLVLFGTSLVGLD